MTLFWLSFASETAFLGAALVEAEDPADLIRKVRALGIAPDDGQCVALSVPEDFPWFDRAMASRDRLLSEKEIYELFPDAGPIRPVGLPKPATSGVWN